MAVERSDRLPRRARFSRWGVRAPRFLQHEVSAPRPARVRAGREVPGPHPF